MRHLISYSVYEDISSVLPEGGPGSLAEMGCDGLELLTGFDPVDPRCAEMSPAVHLPYATDWYRAWSGRDTSDPEDDDVARFMYFGRDRDGVTDTLETALRMASPVDPAYGVLHAGNANIDEILMRDFTDTDTGILSAFAEMVNSVAARFPGGEPPFRILFENLWWPGLKLIDPREYRLLAERVEFDRWGLCLDTGHMMAALGGFKTQEEGAEAVSRVISSYPEDMRDRVVTMHLHMSTSKDYISSFAPRGREGRSAMDMLSEGYPHVGRIDQHLPFSSDVCVGLVEALRPDFLTHEMVSPDRVKAVGDFSLQRSFFR